MLEKPSLVIAEPLRQQNLFLCAVEIGPPLDGANSKFHSVISSKGSRRSPSRLRAGIRNGLPVWTATGEGGARAQIGTLTASSRSGWLSVLPLAEGSGQPHIYQERITLTLDVHREQGTARRTEILPQANFGGATERVYPV